MKHSLLGDLQEIIDEITYNADRIMCKGMMKKWFLEKYVGRRCEIVDLDSKYRHYDDRRDRDSVQVTIMKAVTAQSSVIIKTGIIRYCFLYWQVGNVVYMNVRSF